MVTLGTGIGSALFIDGELVPNTELGHLKMGKQDAERLAADSVREAEQLSWKEWAERLDEYLSWSRRCSRPTSSSSAAASARSRRSSCPAHPMRTEIVPAQLLNEAGIVGAALAQRAGVPHRRGSSTRGGARDRCAAGEPASGQCHHSMASSPSSQQSR